MPNSNDKFQTLLLEKLSEISDRTARMEGKFEMVVRDIEQIKSEDRKQNDLLAEHIQGTISNRERLEIEIQNRRDLEKVVEDRSALSDERMKRLEKLEEGPKFLGHLKTTIMYVVTVGGAIAAVANWFFKK